MKEKSFISVCRWRSSEFAEIFAVYTHLYMHQQSINRVERVLMELLGTEAEIRDSALFHMCLEYFLWCNA